MQLTTALEGFWLSKARSLSQNTVNDYNHSYGHFIRFLADQHVEEIETVTPQHINAFLTWLDTDCGLAPRPSSTTGSPFPPCGPGPRKSWSYPTSSAAASSHHACGVSSPNPTPRKTSSV